MARIRQAKKFARGVFAHVDVGDVRRSRAVVEVVAGLARRPAGRISAALPKGSQRERAYRLVENRAVTPLALLVAAAAWCARRIARLTFAYVVVDGTSLTLADHFGTKGFGRVGTNCRGSRGLKVINALALDDKGTPIGIAWQEYWCRAVRKRRKPKRQDNLSRDTCEKETQRWIDTIRAVVERLRGKTLLWFLVDREGDSRPLLEELGRTGQRFTVRTTYNRTLAVGANGKKHHLYDVVKKGAPRGTYKVRVPKTDTRAARLAHMEVRAKSVRLLLRDPLHNTKTFLDVNVVWATEVGTTPRGAKPLDWMLYTNAPITTEKAVMAVLQSYKMRWRIEDFHKSWKTGHCNVEDMQLHSVRAAQTLAIMQAAIAARIERLKHLARTVPDTPASVEFTRDERLAISILAHDYANVPLVPGGRRQHKLVAPDPDTMTIGEALWWIARLGGYSGRSTGARAGAITIGRGLDDVVSLAGAIPFARKALRSDQW